MNSLLSELGYSLNPITHVWSRSDFSSIDYSDGDEIEQRIAAAISQTNDVSVLSSELKTYCIDWPSLYHLGANRANILRPFLDIIQGAKVLEIGSGCGAITRFLGESGAHVLALEGSQRRAAITRSRTRELNNVSVVSEQFDRFSSKEKFDVITLIGVLEYANVFMPGEHPVQAMLQHAKSMLKPDGKLIIAIENQLGLKYFAGAPEDHHGQPMYGLEGHYKNNQATTYGRHVLKEQLEQAGFSEHSFFAPFPDYKLPISIITEQGFACDEFDTGALIKRAVIEDHQLPPSLSFSPELVWTSVLANKIGLELANSFLIVAQNTKKNSSMPEILAYHYATAHRARIFCKETFFLKTKMNTIELHCRAIEPASSIESGDVQQRIESLSSYIRGRQLSSDYVNIVGHDGWNLEDISSFFKRYLSIVTSIVSKDESFESITAETLIPGSYIDLVPQNIIIDGNETAHIIDNEWAANSPLTAGFLVFRSLYLLHHSVYCYGKTNSFFPKTVRELFLAVYKTIGFVVNEEKLQSYLELEAAFQSKICHGAIEIPQLNYPLKSTESNPNNQTAAFESLFLDKDNHIRSIESILKDKEEQLLSVQKQMQEQLRSIRNQTQEQLNQMHEKLLSVQKQMLEQLKKRKIATIKNKIIQKIFFRNAIKICRKSPFFDSHWYLNTYPDVKAIGLDPIIHYIKYGAQEYRDPGPNFSTINYLIKNEALAKKGINPLVHFEKSNRHLESER